MAVINANQQLAGSLPGLVHREDADLAHGASPLELALPPLDDKGARAARADTQVKAGNAASWVAVRIDRITTGAGGKGPHRVVCQLCHRPLVPGLVGFLGSIWEAPPVWEWHSVALMTNGISQESP